MFEKTISRTEMIDHSFESKNYGACYRLCENVVCGYSRAQRALKLLKLRLSNQPINQLLQKLYQSIFEAFCNFCRSFKPIRQLHQKILSK